MTQAAAIFLDAYRELNSRKMFWITLIISALFVSVLLMVGLTEKHQLKLLFWETPIPMPPSYTLADLLKSTYVSIGIGLWLSWAATILALISTASIFPDFVSGGAIDLMLAKPISRVRLYLLKYASGLLFVALQVGAFSLVAFLLIGIRSGAWLPGLFIAVPLVLAFFSYLFCVCALLGIFTRSTVAALLLTLLFWLFVFGTNMADSVLVMPRVTNELYVEKLQQRLETQREKENPDAHVIEALQNKVNEAAKDAASWRRWHGLIIATKTVLPKTDETIKLLERWLIKSADLPPMPEDDEQQHGRGPFITPEMYATGVRPHEVVDRVEQDYRNRPVWWIIGTSLAFEAVVLVIGGFIFVRRDF